MFDKLQQDKDCDKVEQKIHQEEGDQVRRVKEIQPEQHIEEAETLMSDEVEV